MRSRVPRSALLVGLLIAAGSVNAEKTTVDPNAGPVPAAQAAAVDARLAQKVAYQKGYGRLHAILDELSAQTGVAIRAGLNTKDWQARDIPVFVEVQDLALGKLLSTLSDAAHVQLTSQRVEGDRSKNRTYRLYRTKTYQDSISRPVQDKLAKGIELAKWSWDALVAHSRLDEPAALPPSNSTLHSS